MLRPKNLLLCAFLLLLGSGVAQAQSYLSFDNKAAGLVLAADGKTLPLLVSPEDHKGVLRAATDLQHDVNNAGALVYAVAFDDEKPQLLNISQRRPGESWVNDNAEKAMMDNICITESTHTIARAGVHTLRFWVITPGIVLQKLVIDTGGLKPRYLGLPESFRVQ
ncbi:hypothetical protein H8B13_18010 [Hymenobacter sp. BT188]|uniref:hypothetical protein n=1 Tax=Hymenobacter sp. BT188 TaxID=2763504 RepID=UPI0016511CBF|nr:hypothetical protein [Hymenobacter sp. BT188]MBC6608728.1 hypothetical protein [Hymenobacter sp. BT188]